MWNSFPTNPESILLINGIWGWEDEKKFSQRVSLNESSLHLQSYRSFWCSVGAKPPTPFIACFADSTTFSFWKLDLIGLNSFILTFTRTLKRTQQFFPFFVWNMESHFISDSFFFLLIRQLKAVSYNFLLWTFLLSSLFNLQFICFKYLSEFTCVKGWRKSKKRTNCYAKCAKSYNFPREKMLLKSTLKHNKLRVFFCFFTFVLDFDWFFNFHNVFYNVAN